MNKEQELEKEIKELGEFIELEQLKSYIADMSIKFKKLVEPITTKEIEKRNNEKKQLISYVLDIYLNTDLRLGQLIGNVVNENELYYISDEELYEKLKDKYHKMFTLKD